MGIAPGTGAVCSLGAIPSQLKLLPLSSLSASSSSSSEPTDRIPSSQAYCLVTLYEAARAFWALLRLFLAFSRHKSKRGYSLVSSWSRLVHHFPNSGPSCAPTSRFGPCAAATYVTIAVVISTRQGKARALINLCSLIPKNKHRGKRQPGGVSGCADLHVLAGAYIWQGWPPPPSADRHQITSVSGNSRETLLRRDESQETNRRGKPCYIQLV